MVTFSWLTYWGKDDMTINLITHLANSDWATHCYVPDTRKTAKLKIHGSYPQSLSLGKKTDINHFIININYVKCLKKKQQGTQLRLGETVEVISEGILKGNRALGDMEREGTFQAEGPAHAKALVWGKGGEGGYQLSVHWSSPGWGRGLDQRGNKVDGNKWADECVAHRELTGGYDWSKERIWSHMKKWVGYNV